MKKIIILLVLNLSLFASVNDIEKEIYATILRAIFPNKPTISVWSDNKNKTILLHQIPFVQITSPQKADIVFIYHEPSIPTLPLKKIIFVGSYSLLKKYKNRVIGGFFWQKGRPNIIFLEKNLKKFHIHLPPEFDKYIEDTP